MIGYILKSETEVIAVITVRKNLEIDYSARSRIEKAIIEHYSCLVIDIPAQLDTEFSGRLTDEDLDAYNVKFTLQSVAIY